MSSIPLWPPLDLVRKDLDPDCVPNNQGVAAAVLPEAEMDAIERAVRDEVAEAVRFGLASPHPDPDEAYDHVFVDPITDLRASAWRA